MNISIIVAMDLQHAIGRDQHLLCHLPNDMKHFKTLTLGHPVIMGRKTFESLPKGALPERTNIIVSTNMTAEYENAILCGSLDEALHACRDEEEVFIIGGGSIYKQALPLADKIYLTLIHHIFEDADTFFPQILASEWTETSRQDFKKDEKNPYSHSFLTYLRKNKHILRTIINN